MSASNLQGRSILVVDDEPVFARTLADGLGSELKGVVVQLANHGQRALEILAREPVDLVVTDVHMPVMDGMSLVAEMVSRGINLPVIMVTAFGTRAIELDARRNGVISVVDKPIDFPLMVEICAGMLRSRSRGSIEGITLAGFLQLLEMERRTCTVRIFGDEGTGTIGMRDGQVVLCSVSEATGFEALCQIVSWDSPRIELLPLTGEGEEKPLSLNVALLEGARLQDEAHRTRQDHDKETPIVPPPPKTKSRAKSSSSSRPRANGQGDAKRTANIATIEEATNACMDIKGAIAIAVVDYETGICLGSRQVGDFPVEIAAAGNTEVVRAKMSVMKSLGIGDRINDILITLAPHHHIIAPLPQGPLFLYMALDRQTSNLALARRRMMEVGKKLVI